MIERITKLIRYFLGKTVVRYVVAGGATFVVNFGSMAIMLDVLGWGNMTGTFLLKFPPAVFFMEFLEWDESRLLFNLAHAIGTELSFLFAFHAHNWWTWKNHLEGEYWQKLRQFHLATGLTFALRLIGADQLTGRFDWHWLPGSIVPLIVAIMINYVVYNFIIFRKRGAKDEEPAAENGG